MALVVRIEDQGGTSRVDLKGTNSVYIRMDTWRSMPVPGEPLVVETFQAIIKASTRSAARTAANLLRYWLDKAVLWNNDKHETDSVFMRVATDGESAKRALIYAYEMTPAHDFGLGYEMQQNTEVVYDVAITRDAEWEVLTESGVSTLSTLSVAGGTDITDQYGGPAGGRISQLAVTNNQAQIYDKIWVGLKPVATSMSGFDPTWECEDGSAIAGTGTSAPGSVTGASGSDAMLVDFDTGTGEAMTFRFYIQGADIVGLDYDEMKGRYRAILRCKVTAASTTVGIRLNQCYGSPSYNAPLTQLPEVFVDHTDWEIIDLGEVEFPPHSYRKGIDDLVEWSQMSLAFEAERISGAGDLYADLIILVPSEHLFYAEGDNAINASQQIVAITSEDMSHEVFSYTGGTPDTITQSPTTELKNWRYPATPYGLAQVVIAAQRASGDHSLTDTMTLDFDMYKRYKDYVV